MKNDDPAGLAVEVLAGYLRAREVSSAFPMGGDLPEVRATFGGVGLLGSGGGQVRAPIEVRLERGPLSELMRLALANPTTVFRVTLEIINLSEEEIGLQPGWDHG